MINITFSRYVKMNGRQWEVNFRKVPGTESSFYADTPDLQGHRFQFMIYKTPQSNWEMKGTELPRWFDEYLPQLTNAVESGVQEYQTKYVRRAELC